MALIIPLPMATAGLIWRALYLYPPQLTLKTGNQHLLCPDSLPHRA